MAGSRFQRRRDRRLARTLSALRTIDRTIRQPHHLVVDRIRVRVRRERIRRAALMAVASAEDAAQAQDQKPCDQSEEDDVDELKAVAHGPISRQLNNTFRPVATVWLRSRSRSPPSGPVGFPGQQQYIAMYGTGKALSKDAGPLPVDVGRAADRRHRLADRGRRPHRRLADRGAGRPGGGCRQRSDARPGFRPARPGSGDAGGGSLPGARGLRRPVRADRRRSADVAGLRLRSGWPAAADATVPGDDAPADRDADGALGPLRAVDGEDQRAAPGRRRRTIDSGRAR